MQPPKSEGKWSHIPLAPTPCHVAFYANTRWKVKNHRRLLEIANCAIYSRFQLICTTMASDLCEMMKIARDWTWLASARKLWQTRSPSCAINVSAVVQREDLYRVKCRCQRQQPQSPLFYSLKQILQSADDEQSCIDISPASFGVS